MLFQKQTVHRFADYSPTPISPPLVSFLCYLVFRSSVVVFFNFSFLLIFTRGYILTDFREEKGGRERNIHVRKNLDFWSLSHPHPYLLCQYVP